VADSASGSQGGPENLKMKSHGTMRRRIERQDFPSHKLTELDKIERVFDQIRFP